MASQQINVDRLAETIMQDLEIYKNNTVRDVEYAVLKTAKLAVDELKETSPVRTGEYALHWAHRRSPTRGKDYHSRIVYVKKPHYRLTHLLEREHDAVDGSVVAARPHIKRVEEKAQRWMYDILTAQMSKRRSV